MFEIFRFDPEIHHTPRFDRFKIKVRKYMNILDGLFEILDTQDGSLAFRYACRGAVCGSCSMLINGKPRLACQTLIERLKTDVIKLEPLRHLNVIKDLIVDMNPFFEKLKTIKPYFVSGRSLETEFLQSPKHRLMIDNSVNCILCDLCDAACPIISFKTDFLGPASLVKAHRFIFDSRDEALKNRLKRVNTALGVWSCRTIAYCTDVCPKVVNPSRCISALKRKLISGLFRK